MKRLTVFVGGIRSVLQSPESEEYMRLIASKADHMLRAVKQENPSLSTDKAAVLALINAVDYIQRVEHSNETKFEDHLQARRHIERLEAALKQAKEQLNHLQGEGASEIPISPDQLSFREILED